MKNYKLIRKIILEVAKEGQEIVDQKGLSVYGHAFIDLSYDLSSKVFEKFKQETGFNKDLCQKADDKIISAIIFKIQTKTNENTKRN